MKKAVFKKIFSKRAFLILLVLGVTIPLVFFPDRYVKSVFGGMELFALSVLPALFPFFFFSQILSELNFGYDIGLVLKRPLRALFKAPPVAGYILAMSMLCGYPIGARLLSDYYERGLIDGEQVKRISSFTSTSGPLFIVGTVGVGMLGDKTAGYVVLLSHYLSAVINGVLYGLLLGRKKKAEAELVPPLIDYGSVLKKSMTSAVSSVAAVGGYVAVFNMVADLLSDVGLIGALATGLTYFGLPLRLGQGVCASMIEVTKGCLIFSSSGFSYSVIEPLIALAVTFGGLSVTMQSLTYLSKCRVRAPYYLLTKTTQATFAFGVCKLLCLLFF
ncbi:MAG: hypothetical protein IJ735_00750 [Clostridia bacterium]|nr:hypothetical protein [Clostridia bacterium]